MEKPRDIKTLLLLVLVHVDFYIPKYGGLCIMYAVMKTDFLLTQEEYKMLYFYTLNHRPAHIDDDDGYFWPMCNVDARKEFIENLISKL